MEKIQSIDRYGKQAKGRKELRSHLEGKRLTLRQMILAKCYDCMGYFADGKVDCNIPECALYPVMVYRKGYKPRSLKLSEDQKAAMRERGRSIPRKTPNFALEHDDSSSRGKENAGGIPDPTPGEKDSSSTVKKHFSGKNPKTTPKNHVSKPFSARKSPKRDPLQGKRGQIPLFKPE